MRTSDATANTTAATGNVRHLLRHCYDTTRRARALAKMIPLQQSKLLVLSTTWMKFFCGGAFTFTNISQFRYTFFLQNP